MFLFLDNATVHPTSLVDKFNNIKVVFLPKNSTSRLQLLDAEIIQSFIQSVKQDLLAWEIAKQIDVLQAIEWVAKVWKEVTAETIKNCFAKSGFTEETSEIEDDIVDEEFNALFKELTDSDCETTAEEYIDFDVETWGCCLQSTQIL